MATNKLTPRTYAALLSGIKSRIRDAQVRAAISVNRELILLYWTIGREILARQQNTGWGSGVIASLARDLHAEFPTMNGLSQRNLGYMRTFAEAWPDESILNGPLANLTWYHNITLLEKASSTKERLWYAEQAVANGWSRNVLVFQIERRTYRRQGKAISNFKQTLPAAQSDLAQQLLKDPYNFDFLALTDSAKEKDLESALLLQLRKFLIELGVGFAFVGSQVPIQVGGEDFKLDLLFYHLKLRCFVIIDLKMGPFKPEYAGKMNFYLSAADDILRHPQDNRSIGLILCRAKNRIIAEYALRDLVRPLGISEFQHLVKLPRSLKGTLPTIKEIENSLTQAESAPPKKQFDMRNLRRLSLTSTNAFVYSAVMPRPRPTPGEWEILQALWTLGPATVREVHETLANERPVQYTTTLKLMQILTEKGLVRRDERERAHRYEPTVTREELQSDVVEDLLERVFGGSAAELMQRALSRRRPSRKQVAELRRMIENWEDGSR